VLFVEFFVFRVFFVPAFLLETPRDSPARLAAAGVFPRSPAEFFARLFGAFAALAAVLFFFLPVSIETGFRSLIVF
jgi:hypothetical protein